MSFRSVVARDLSILSLIIFLITLTPVTAQAGDLEMEVSNVKAPVKAKLRNTDRWKTVSGNGLSLESLRDIKVGDDGLLKLSSPKNDEIKITGNSRLDVDLNDRGPSTIELDVGGINVDFNDETTMKRSLKVKTANAVIGVRGTHFSVLHDGRDLTHVAVFEGEVRVSNRTDQSIILRGGDRARVDDRELSRSNRGTDQSSSQSSTPSSEGDLHETTWDRWQAKQRLGENLRKRERFELRKERSLPSSVNERSAITDEEQLQELEHRVTDLKNQLSQMTDKIRSISPDLNLSASIGAPAEVNSTGKTDLKEVQSRNGPTTEEIEHDQLEKPDQPTNKIKQKQAMDELDTNRGHRKPNKPKPIQEIDPKQIEIKTSISSPDEIKP